MCPFFYLTEQELVFYLIYQTLDKALPLFTNKTKVKTNTCTSSVVRTRNIIVRAVKDDARLGIAPSWWTVPGILIQCIYTVA